MSGDVNVDGVSKDCGIERLDLGQLADEDAVTPRQETDNNTSRQQTARTSLVISLPSILSRPDRHHYSCQQERGQGEFFSTDSSSVCLAHNTDSSSVYEAPNTDSSSVCLAPTADQTASTCHTRELTTGRDHHHATADAPVTSHHDFIDENQPQHFQQSRHRLSSGFSTDDETQIVSCYSRSAVGVNSVSAESQTRSSLFGSMKCSPRYDIAEDIHRAYADTLENLSQPTWDDDTETVYTHQHACHSFHTAHGDQRTRQGKHVEPFQVSSQNSGKTVPAVSATMQQYVTSQKLQKSSLEYCCIDGTAIHQLADSFFKCNVDAIRKALGQSKIPEKPRPTRKQQVPAKYCILPSEEAGDRQGASYISVHTYNQTTGRYTWNLIPSQQKPNYTVAPNNPVTSGARTGERTHKNLDNSTLPARTMDGRSSIFDLGLLYGRTVEMGNVLNVSGIQCGNRPTNRKFHNEKLNMQVTQEEMEQMRQDAENNTLMCQDNDCSQYCSLSSTETDDITTRSLKRGLAPLHLDQTGWHDVPAPAPPEAVDGERDTVEVFAMRFVDEREAHIMTSPCSPKQRDAVISPQPPGKPRDPIPTEATNLNLNSSRRRYDADENTDPTLHENNDPPALNPNHNTRHANPGHQGGFKWTNPVDPPRIELSKTEGKGKAPSTFSGLSLAQKKLKMLKLAKSMKAKHMKEVNVNNGGINGLTEVNHGSGESGVKLRPSTREANHGRKTTDAESTPTARKTRAKKSGQKMSGWKSRHDATLGEVSLDQLHFAITPKMPAIIPPLLEKNRTNNLSSHCVHWSEDDSSDSSESTCSILKHTMQSSVRMRKELPPLQPRKLCFRCKISSCNHGEVIQEIESQTNVKVKWIQYDPIKVQAFNLKLSEGLQYNCLWIFELTEESDRDGLLFEGFYLRDTHMNVRHLDDVYKEEFMAYKMWSEINREQRQKKLTQRHNSRVKGCRA
ncbi:uncharacterized protein LOC131951436 [Physella acuta]|uniref:uncharacterized protein LOC131951436 n=1 Tax=Physella acuta TaxID=109671 RepID=UPI0027DC457D|nr:uncharacterized protein LOC131951436 [Physella acuta]